MIEQKYVDEIKQEFDGRFVGDAKNRFTVGDIGFLLELTPPSGHARVELRDSPARTHDWEDILFGMVEGKTNVEALGVGKITEVVKNGRGKVLTVWGEELDRALLELGYPDIAKTEYTVERGFVK